MLIYRKTIFAADSSASASRVGHYGAIQMYYYYYYYNIIIIIS